MNCDLTRFEEAHDKMYEKALAEIKSGEKTSHWMWFIFPQLKGLGKSDTAYFYGITNVEEVAAYLTHPQLGKHLIEISEAVLQIENKTATEVLGTPDDKKLWSSMTLFSKVKNTPPVFEQVLKKYFNGLYDERTLALIG